MPPPPRFAYFTLQAVMESRRPVAPSPEPLVLQSSMRRTVGSGRRSDARSLQSLAAALVGTGRKSFKKSSKTMHVLFFPGDPITLSDDWGVQSPQQSKKSKVYRFHETIFLFSIVVHMKVLLWNHPYQYNGSMEVSWWSGKLNLPVAFGDIPWGPWPLPSGKGRFIFRVPY